MTPEQFVAQIGRQPPEPAYLFLGPEAWRRAACRRALIERVLPPGEREQGLTRHDLDEVSLAEVLDDACSMSLFAADRVIWVYSAEAVLPRGRAAAKEDALENAAAALTAYFKQPPPATVLVFESSRFDFEGEDKARIERVRKFYSMIPAVVEFPRYTPSEAHQLARKLAAKAGLRIGAEEIGMLVETLNSDATRIATEIEKLRLFAGEGGAVGPEQIAAMVPDSRQTTVFALVEALGRKDRVKSLELLDSLVREGEYLPLALTFLAAQFRFALAAREAGLRGAQQIQTHFSKLGPPMWRSRAEQIHRTMTSFSPAQLAEAGQIIFAADRALRDARPDDRIVMEEFVLRLTR